MPQMPHLWNIILKNISLLFCVQKSTFLQNFFSFPIKFCNQLQNMKRSYRKTFHEKHQFQVSTGQNNSLSKNFMNIFLLLLNFSLLNQYWNQHTYRTSTIKKHLWETSLVCSVFIRYEFLKYFQKQRIFYSLWIEYIILKNAYFSWDEKNFNSSLSILHQGYLYCDKNYLPKFGRTFRIVRKNLAKLSKSSQKFR